MKRKISRAFIAAVLGAIAVVVQEPKDPHAWATAVSIVAAAVSGGARKREN